MELKTISKIYFARLSNAYHVSFLSNVKAGLEKYDAVQLGIPVNLYSAFLAALEIEQDIDEMMKIEMCRNVIDELNLLVKDFKAKAYKKTNLDDEELESEDEDENLRHEDENENV